MDNLYLTNMKQIIHIIIEKNVLFFSIVKFLPHLRENKHI